MEASTTKAKAGKNINSSYLFCAHLNSLEVVFEDALTAVVLHEDWSVRGHAMVIWKAHVENISQLTEDQARHASAYRRGFGVGAIGRQLWASSMGEPRDGGFARVLKERLDNLRPPE